MSVVDFLTSLDRGDTIRRAFSPPPIPTRARARSDRAALQAQAAARAAASAAEMADFDMSTGQPMSTEDVTDMLAAQQEQMMQELDMRFGMTGNEEDYTIPGWMEHYDMRGVDYSGNPWAPESMTRYLGIDGKPMPRDADGSQVYSWGELKAQFFDMSPDERGELEMLLWGAGYLDDPPATPGDINNLESIKAWDQALTNAAMADMAVYTMLVQGFERRREAGLLSGSRSGRRSGRGGGGGGAGPRRPTIQLTPEDDVEAMIDQILPNLLGRALRDDERKIGGEIVKALHARQREEQNRMIDQQLAGGGSVEAPTSPNTIVTGELEDRFADESKAYGVAEAFVQMTRMMGGR